MGHPVWLPDRKRCAAEKGKAGLSGSVPSFLGEDIPEALVFPLACTLADLRVKQLPVS